MKYPRTIEDGMKALDEYNLNVMEEMPMITVSLIHDIKEDEVRLMDALLIDGTPCERPLVCIKSMVFDLCDTSRKELEINEYYMEVKSFISAADAISQYIYTRREIDEIL